MTNYKDIEGVHNELPDFKTHDVKYGRGVPKMDTVTEFENIKLFNYYEDHAISITLASLKYQSLKLELVDYRQKSNPNYSYLTIRNYWDDGMVSEHVYDNGTADDTTLDTIRLWIRASNGSALVDKKDKIFGDTVSQIVQCPSIKELIEFHILERDMSKWTKPY